MRILHISEHVTLFLKIPRHEAARFQTVTLNYSSTHSKQNIDIMLSGDRRDKITREMSLRGAGVIVGYHAHYADFLQCTFAGDRGIAMNTT